jgi:hypothetical protein
MTLSRAEDGFRALKSDLGLRPMRHQRTDRGDSHILVSVLAYHLLQFISFTLGQRGDHRRWGTLRRVLGTHCYTTIVLPTTAGKVHRLRVPGDPDQAQTQIYTALGINWKDPGVRGRSPCSKSRLAGRCPKSALGWGPLVYDCLTPRRRHEPGLLCSAFGGAV